MSIFSKWFSNKEPESSTSDEPRKPQLSASDYCEQGQKSLDAGKYVEAMEFLQAAIEADRHFEKAYLLLASAYEKQGKKDKAKAALYGLLAIDPNNAEALKRIDELNGENDKPLQNESFSTVSSQTSNSIPNNPNSHQPQNSPIGNYRIFDGKNDDAFDFFVMFEDGNRVYFKCKNNELVVTMPNGNGHNGWDGYIKPKGDLVIPMEIVYKGMPFTVSIIGGSAFSGCDLLNAIVLPDSIKVIGSFAFQSCKGLKRIILPDTIVTIGNHAFVHCASLWEANLPSSLSEIEFDLFSYCDNLGIVTIPNNVRKIKRNAFRAFVPKKRLCLIMKGLPPDCEGNLGRDDVLVKVPKGTLEAYLTAPYWQCLNIQEET